MPCLRQNKLAVIGNGRYTLRMLFVKKMPAALAAGLVFCLCVLAPPPANADPEFGHASWYGERFHGQTMANGDSFDKHAYSAAHRTLPFGTVLRVYNPKNGRQVLVQVRDRGPYKRKRVLDVSRQAAQRLDIIKIGVTTLAFEAISDDKGRPLDARERFYLMFSRVNSAIQAPGMLEFLQKRSPLPLCALKPDDPGRPVLICAGPFESFDEVQAKLTALFDDFPRLEIVTGNTDGSYKHCNLPPRRPNPSKPRQNTGR